MLSNNHCTLSLCHNIYLPKHSIDIYSLFPFYRHLTQLQNAKNMKKKITLTYHILHKRCLWCLWNFAMAISSHCIQFIESNVMMLIITQFWVITPIVLSFILATVVVYTIYRSHWWLYYEIAVSAVAPECDAFLARRYWYPSSILGHCTALHCTALHCTALHCTALTIKSAP